MRVVAGELTQFRESFSATGYNSADDPAMLFGLGRRDEVDIVEVTWPSGKVQTPHAAKAGQTLIIREAE